MDNMKISDKLWNSLENSNKAVPSEDFMLKMENIALAYSQQVASFSTQAMIGLAASFLLLVAVNIYAVSNYNIGNSDSNESVYSESYDLIPTKFIYND